MNIRLIIKAIPLFIVFCGEVNAGVVIGGTRVIYSEDKKEASLLVNNPDNFAYLIQSWVESTNNKRDFIVTPPLFRLEANQQNVLRIILMNKNLPQDRESLFWLSIKSIPSTEKKDNTLQIAVKTRLKLIYRPTKLIEKMPEDFTESLKWHSDGKRIIVDNPTGYYMNFQSIRVNGKEIKKATYAPPYSSVTYDVEDAQPHGDIEWKLINDYGAVGKNHLAKF